MALTLAVVNALIEAKLSGHQSFSTEGMSVQNYDLKTLLDLRKQLQREAGNAFGFRMNPLQPPEH